MKFFGIYFFISCGTWALSTHISQNGKCGTISGRSYTCYRSRFGNCCSQHGHCGSSEVYCGKTCQPAYGSCSEVLGSTPKPGTTSKCTAYAKTSPSSPSTLRTSTVRVTSTPTSAPTSSLSSIIVLPSLDSSSTLSSASSCIEMSLSTLMSETISLIVDVPTPTTSSSLSSFSTASSSSIITSTSDIAPSSSSAAPSPSPAGPSCATNYVVNGDFEDISTITSQYGIRVTGGAASINSYSNQIVQPVSGGNYLSVSTGSSPTFTFFQVLDGITAGTTVDCGLLVNFPGDAPEYLSVASIAMSVDGQTCGTLISVQTQGWVPIPISNAVTVTNDNPRVQVSFTPDNVFGNRLYVGFDNLRVARADLNGKPIC